jgi:Flp pilus assembly protein TadD
LDIALALAQKAREASPGDPNVADTLGWIQLKKGAHLAAIGLLKESNEQFKGRNPSVLYHLGIAYLKAGDKVLAQDSLSKALALGMAFKDQDETKKTLSQLKSS